MKTAEKWILGIALIFMGVATLDRVLEVGDPCFQNPNEACIEAKLRGE